MKGIRLFTLLLAGLSLCAAPLALVGQASSPSPPLCRVRAVYGPTAWASTLRPLTVGLAPGCPANGIARVRLGGYGGPGSRATGPTETLTRDRPSITWAAQPRYRTVLIIGRDGRTSSVPLEGVSRREEQK